MRAKQPTSVQCKLEGVDGQKEEQPALVDVVDEDEFLPSEEGDDDDDDDLEAYDEESDGKDDGESDEDEANEDAIGRNQIKKNLREDGLEVYCDVLLNVKEAADCSKTQTLMSRLAAFLQWTHEHIKGTALDPETALQWFAVFIGGGSSRTLQQYCKYLLNDKMFTPGTIVNTLADLSTAAEWLCLFSPYVKYFGEKQTEIAAFNLVSVLNFSLPFCDFSLFKILKVTKKGYNAKKKERSNSQPKIQEGIRDRRIPEGGLQELQATFLEELTGFLARWRESAPLKTRVKECIGLLIAGCYVLAPQGRISGFASMKMDNVPALQKGHSLAKDFKTKGTYGYQPVIFPEEVQSIFKIYIEDLRPAVVGGGRVCGTDPLWINGKGLAVAKSDLSRSLTRFYEKSIGLHISPTMCRALVETHVAQKFENGTIIEYLYYIFATKSFSAQGI